MSSDLDKRFTTVMKYHDGSAPVRLVGHLVICERTVNLLFCETVTGALILTGVLSWPGRKPRPSRVSPAINRREIFPKEISGD
jgi:hypothetical protein